MQIDLFLIASTTHIGYLSPAKNESEE